MSNSPSQQELHLVLGAGQVGTLVAEMLVAKGHRVRVARKSATPSRVRGIENVTVDVRDALAVARAAQGAAVVYHCVNPLYYEWPELLLPMARGIVEGTARAGARLVVLDNLYMYGDTSDIRETTEIAPRSKKGVLRVEAANLMLAADRRGDVEVAIGRAADFFGPRALLAMPFGERFYQRVFAGKSAEYFGDPDLLHAYSYTPDVAAGLVAMGARAGTRGVWMLPVNPAESTRALFHRFARALDRDIPLSRLPTWMLRTAGVFSPLLREVAEMAYQWEQPYVVDDAKFRAAFGFGATPWDQAIAATVDWAREAYGARPGRASPSARVRISAEKPSAIA
jgi:nucleoside-diphosphate-sugar epimerase